MKIVNKNELEGLLPGGGGPSFVAWGVLNEGRLMKAGGIEIHLPQRTMGPMELNVGGFQPHFEM